MPSQEISLPIPHPLQREIEDSPAKRKVVVVGRRAGKTVMVSRIACKGLLAGKRVLYATPKETQTETFWRNCKDWLAPLLPYGLYKNETLHLLEMPGLGTIRAKTGYDADTLRGDYADIL